MRRKLEGKMSSDIKILYNMEIYSFRILLFLIIPEFSNAQIYSNTFYLNQEAFNINSTAVTYSGTVTQKKRRLCYREPCTM